MSVLVGESSVACQVAVGVVGVGGVAEDDGGGGRGGHGDVGEGGAGRAVRQETAGSFPLLQVELWNFTFLHICHHLRACPLVPQGSVPLVPDVLHTGREWIEIHPQTF